MQTHGRWGLVQGTRIDAESVFLLPPGAEFYFAGPGDLEWFSVHIPQERIAIDGDAPPRELGSGYMVTPSATVPHGLSAMIGEFIRAEAVQPSVVSEPLSSLDFSEALVSTARQIVGARQPSNGSGRSLARQRRLTSMAVELIEDCAQSVPTVRVLARKVGVPKGPCIGPFARSSGSLR